MHFRTHVKEESAAWPRSISGPSGDEYTAAWSSTTCMSVSCSKLLDELGIADETIVMYSTDNGPHYNTWPDAGATPFRGEKNTNWEGGWRVPAAVRWPGKIEPGSVTNEIVHHMDWLPTFSPPPGDPDIKDELMEGGVEAIGREYKVHLDGYNFSPASRRDRREARAGDLLLFRRWRSDRAALQHWKAIFLEQRSRQRSRPGPSPSCRCASRSSSTCAAIPMSAQITSNTYYDWLIDRVFLLVPAQAYVGNFLKTFQEFPPRQKAASFSLDQVMEKLAPPTS
jgi:hypothetical protein